MRQFHDGEGDLEAVRVLRGRLRLSPYESRAYLELITNGEAAPGRLGESSGIPRPRTYDVLRSLVGKGLAVERKGRPIRYKAIDPRHGLLNLLDLRESEVKEDLSQARASVKRVMRDLGKLYEQAEARAGLEERVVLSGTSGAFWEQFQMLKERTRREYVGATTSALVPPYDIFLKEERLLRKGVRLRLIRPFPPMRRLYVEWYLRLIGKGFEIRSSNKVGFSFDVSDGTDALIWLNDRTDHPSTEVLWLQRTPLANLLASHFETLWAEGEPVKDRLEKMLD